MSYMDDKILENEKKMSYLDLMKMNGAEKAFLFQKAIYHDMINGKIGFEDYVTKVRGIEKMKDLY